MEWKGFDFYSYCNERSIFLGWDRELVKKEQPKIWEWGEWWSQLWERWERWTRGQESEVALTGRDTSSPEERVCRIGWWQVSVRSAGTEGDQDSWPSFCHDLSIKWEVRMRGENEEGRDWESKTILKSWKMLKEYREKQTENWKNRWMTLKTQMKLETLNTHTHTHMQRGWMIPSSSTQVFKYRRNKGKWSS